MPPRRAEWERGRKKTVDGAFRYARKKGRRNLCEGDGAFGGGRGRDGADGQRDVKI